jgi:outer membrane protein assembly factor BamE
VRKTLLLSLCLVSASCSYLAPYKLEFQQGNVVTQETVSKLKPGMTKSQVGFLLGTPLLTDTFHRNRWDYVYYIRHRSTLRDRRAIALFFEDDKLTRIEGDVVTAQDRAKFSIASEKADAAQGKPNDSAVPDKAGASPAATGGVDQHKAEPAEPFKDNEKSVPVSESTGKLR